MHRLRPRVQAFGKELQVAYEEDIVAESLREFASLQLGRAVFDSHWDETAELVLPSFRNTFTPGAYNMQGEKKAQKQVDSTAALALTRFSAILDSLLTPRNMMWHTLSADNEELAKIRDVRLWFEMATRALFKQRYKPSSNFSSQNLNTYTSLGAFGNGALWIDALHSHDGAVGLRYKSVPLGEIYFRENFQGKVDGFCRFFRLNKKQAVEQFGEDKLPEGIKTSTDMNAIFDFLHRVCPRLDYDKERMDVKGKPWASYYIAIQGKALLSEGGYTSFPVSVSRYDQSPGETYGRGPAMTVLSTIKTLNAEKRDFLTQGHRAAVPVLLTTDDGVVDFSMRPGALNKGGFSSDGKPLVGTLPTGNIQVSKEMMDTEITTINDAFLVNLFRVLQENPSMTATQVIEIVNQKGILLAPTVGRQQSEYLGPMIDRELDVLAFAGLLPPMPEILKEARSEYNVVYTSPMSRAMRAQEVSGFGRTMEILTAIVNTTQDPSPLDNFDFDVISKEIADIQSVPESWMASPEMVGAKKQQRQEAMQQQSEIQAAPAAAAMMKAKAVSEKAGAK